MRAVTRACGSLSIFASVACLVHCMTMPIIIGVLPLLGMKLMITSSLEKMIIITSIIFSTLGLCWGYKTHGNCRIFFFIAAACEWYYIADHNHLLYSVVGCVCLAISNIMNRMLCKKCHKCKE